jgi:hypothetical protein
MTLSGVQCSLISLQRNVSASTYELASPQAQRSKSYRLSSVASLPSPTTMHGSVLIAIPQPEFGAACTPPLPQDASWYLSRILAQLAVARPLSRDALLQQPLSIRFPLFISIPHPLSLRPAFKGPGTFSGGRGSGARARTTLQHIDALRRDWRRAGRSARILFLSCGVWDPQLATDASLASQQAAAADAGSGTATAFFYSRGGTGAEQHDDATLWASDDEAGPPVSTSITPAALTAAASQDTTGALARQVQSGDMSELGVSFVEPSAITGLAGRAAPSSEEDSRSEVVSGALRGGSSSSSVRASFVEGASTAPIEEDEASGGVEGMGGQSGAQPRSDAFGYATDQDDLAGDESDGGHTADGTLLLLAAAGASADPRVSPAAVAAHFSGAAQAAIVSSDGTQVRSCSCPCAQIVCERRRLPPPVFAACGQAQCMGCGKRTARSASLNRSICWCGCCQRRIWTSRHQHSGTVRLILRVLTKGFMHCPVCLYDYGVLLCPCVSLVDVPLKQHSNAGHAQRSAELVAFTKPHFPFTS